MDGGLSDIAGGDLDILKNASPEMLSWMENVKTATNCKSHNEVLKEKLMRNSKETLVRCLLEGYQTVHTNSVKFEDARTCIEKIKSEMIAAQRSVVKLQQQMLEAQADQLKSMSSVVDTAVDRGIRSYSEIVSRTIENATPDLSEKKLKKVVQEAVNDEDRSKNVVVFGLAEESSEDLNGKITALFEGIEEKPSFEAVRVGKVSDNNIRPVKVLLRNSDSVHQILVKAKKLRTTQDYRKVYISPDRSPEERDKHRELVAEMRRQAKEDPDRYYFLCSGAIGCRDK